MKKIMVLIALISWAFLMADIPEGYYDEAEGVNGEELKTVLHNIINNHSAQTYNFLRDVLLPYADEDPNNVNNVILIYTGWSRAKSDFGGMPNDWNREHVWAKSHGGFDNDPPEGTDAHHICASDVQVNGRRGNLDFDNGGSPYFLNGIDTGCNVSSDSWEPRDEVKGDVARMMFYMAVRYEGTSGETDLELVDNTNSSPNGEPFLGKFSTLLAWHHEDPVDDWEIRRNNRVFEYQNNRNPFIDNPTFVERIWEGAANDITILQPFSDFTVFPNPFNPSTTIQFSTWQSGEISVIIYNVKGQKVKTIMESEPVQNQTLQFTWNGKDNDHNFVSSGVYYCVLKSESETQAKKIMLLK